MVGKEDGSSDGLNGDIFWKNHVIVPVRTRLNTKCKGKHLKRYILLKREDFFKKRCVKKKKITYLSPFPGTRIFLERKSLVMVGLYHDDHQSKALSLGDDSLLDSRIYLAIRCLPFFSKSRGVRPCDRL